MGEPRREVSDAARLVIEAVTPLPMAHTPLDEAVGQVLSEAIIAEFPLPPWTNAAMDGYAIRADDARGASREHPVTLPVVREVAAGDPAGAPLRAGEAVRIFTGGRVPEGADSVVRQEDTEAGDGRVTIFDTRDLGRNLRPAGSDLPRGAGALPAGTVISARQVALLAALGVAEPMVHRRPRVGILVTGDEIVPLSEGEIIRSGRQLANANGPGLAAMVRDAGGIAVPLDIVPDDVSAIRQAIEAAGPRVDLLITTGGVSVGAYDHLPDVMASLGARVLFRGVRMRPGGPVMFGILRGGTPWLGLPGNPVSAAVTFELFGRPLVRRLLGHPTPFREVESFVLAEPIARDATLDLYLRATVGDPGTRTPPEVRLTGAQGSGILTSVARSDALVIIPAGPGTAAAGSTVQGWRW